MTTDENWFGEGVFYRVYQCEDNVTLANEFQKLNNQNIKKMFNNDIDELKEDLDERYDKFYDQYLPE